MDIAVCRLGNRTLYSSFLFISCVSRDPFACPLWFFCTQFQTKNLQEETGNSTAGEQQGLCFAIYDFFLSPIEGPFFKTPMGTRQYTVTNDCIFKSNKMQCSLIFLTACGKAVGRKSMGFGGRVYFNSIFAALLVMRLFSGFSTLSLVLFFPFWKTGIIIIIALKLSGT